MSLFCFKKLSHGLAAGAQFTEQLKTAGRKRLRHDTSAPSDDIFFTSQQGASALKELPELSLGASPPE